MRPHIHPALDFQLAAPRTHRPPHPLRSHLLPCRHRRAPPSLHSLCARTEPFLFGNFAFPRLRLLNPENERIRKTMNPLRKLSFFFKEVALPSLSS